MNMADGVTPPILNPESVPQYGGLHRIGHCHAADTRQKTTNRGVFFELLT
jgi:hypothetical protein